TALLHRQDPRWPTGQLGDCDAINMSAVGTAFPWCQIQHFVMRYNIFNGGGLPTVYAESQYESKMIPGGHFAFHNNLYLRGGDLANPGSSGVAGRTIFSPNTPPPAGGGSITFSPGGQAVYDEPPPTGRQGIYRFDHNSAVRPFNSRKRACVFFGTTQGSIPAPAEDISYANNLLLTCDGEYAPFGDGIGEACIEVADTRGQ